MHIVEACNSENGTIKDKFESVRFDLEILEARIPTDEAKFHAEVSGVGSQMRLQQVVLEEIRTGINILQKQDNTIVEEASEVFQGIHRQPANAAKKNFDNTVQLIAIKAMISKLKDDFRLWRTTQQSLENKVELIEKRIKDLPTKDDLRAHAKAMEVTMARVQEVNTGLTTAMRHYKFSESTSHRPRSVAAGLCGIHPSRSHMFGSDYAPEDNSVGSKESLRDTDCELGFNFGGLRGGDGSNDGNNNGGNNDGNDGNGGCKLGVCN
jgi:polyhydroxyalkanoate synthesis regulator phasin